MPKVPRPQPSATTSSVPVPHSGLVPAVGQESSSLRPRVPDVVPAGWLDRLLAATVDLPLAEGERAVVTAMVDALAVILPGHGVGACFAPDPGGPPQEQFVVVRLPEGVVGSPAGTHPTRLFPEMTCEHVAPLAASPTGSTLHVASNDDDLDGALSPAVHLIDRAAAALGRSLPHARRLAAARDGAGGGVRIDARLVQAEKLATFGQIAAGLVHELNNPLTSIVAYSDYLIRKALAERDPDRAGRAPSVPPPRGEELDDLERLKRIGESANRLLRFTRDLVSYARPSSGAAGPVVLHGVIDQAIAFCEHVLAAAGVRVERRYGADVLAVRGLGEQIVQVFVNLLTNASQAARPGGASGGVVVVTTSLDAPRRRVEVRVEDDGSGIAPEHLSQVFVPFFTTKGERHGTGLGLSIVKSIVEGHGGEIRAESEPGRGARFILELPAWQRP